MRSFLLLPFLVLSCLCVNAAHAGSCVTDKCHSKIGKGQYVHGPVAVGECGVCHEKTGEHKFKKITNVKKLCSRCHDNESALLNSHKAIKSDYRECGKCHDAHQSPKPFLVRN